MTFNKYLRADETDSKIRMPTNELDAHVSNVTVGELIGQLEHFSDRERSMYPWADRFVIGFPLPPWQRPFVWTQEQEIRFIQSIWQGVDVGSYMVNAYELSNSTEFRKFSDILLDGQQRLTALEHYLFDMLPVPDVTGKDRVWSELPRIERRRFSNFHFARANIKSWKETMLRKAYDLRSFGGTAHTEDQRASLSRP